MMQFEPGDTVQCEAPDADGLLRIGELYKVERTFDDGRYITLTIGDGERWQASRFKLWAKRVPHPNEQIPLAVGGFADCVDAGSTILEQGKRYMVLGKHADCVTVKEHGERCHFLASRFKPVVRVKMRSRRVLEQCCNKTVLSRCKACPHSSFPALYSGFSA